MTERKALRIGSAEPFPTGASQYLDAHPGFEEAQPRIYVGFRLAGSKTPYLALLDTGAHYCVLNRDAAASIRDDLTECLGQVELWTAYGRVRGDLFIHPLTLIAEEGEPLDVEALLFISPDWVAPNFFGYTGVLDRIRFAVDPQVNRFFFGALE